MRLRALTTAVALVCAMTSIASAQIFNEIRISSSGATDDVSNFFELFDAPGSSLDGLSVLVISGEFNPGQIDFAFDLTGTSIGSDGFFLAGADAGEFPDADLITGADFFGSPTNFFLVEAFTGMVGDDLDTDDDGTFDGTAFTSLIDSVFLDDGLDDGTDAINYGAGDTVGPDGTFTPAHIFRTVDGTGAFEIGEFGNTDADTPGFSNVAVPEPTSAILFGLAVLGMGTQRRRLA